VVAVLGVACGSSTPAPVVGTPLTITQLKFAVLDSVGTPRLLRLPTTTRSPRPGNELANAIHQIPGDPLPMPSSTPPSPRHEHLPSGDLTDEQKLTVYRAWKLLARGRPQPKRERLLVFISRAVEGGHRLLSDGCRHGAGGRCGHSHLAHAVGCTELPDLPCGRHSDRDFRTGRSRVTDIRAGMLVWTAAADGTKIAVPVVATGSMEVPAGHMMVHLVLADGRELLASPGHRTADGRPAGLACGGRGSRRLDDHPIGARPLLWR